MNAYTWGKAMAPRTLIIMTLLMLLLAAPVAAGEDFESWIKRIIYQDAAFSKADLTTLQRGDVVSRAMDVDYIDQNKLLFFRVYGIVKLPPEECWRRMKNLNALYQTQPLMLEVSQVRTLGTDIYLRHLLTIIGLKFQYVVRYHIQDQSRIITYSLDPTQRHNIIDHFGFWRVQAWENNTTLLEQGTYMELGFRYRPPTWLFKQITLHDFPKTIRRARVFLTGTEAQEPMHP